MELRFHKKIAETRNSIQIIFNKNKLEIYKRKIKNNRKLRLYKSEVTF